MSTPKYVTVGGQYRREEGEPVLEHLDLIALQWSEKTGRKVSRAEVVKAFLDLQLKQHPIGEDEARRLRALPAFPAEPAPERPAKPRLTLATIDGRVLLQERSGDAGRVNQKKGKQPKAA